MVKNSGIIQKVKSKLGLKSLFVIGFLVLLLLFALILNKEKAAPKGEPQRYKISSNEYPRFKEVYLDPFDFRPGEEQIVYVKLENPNPIEKVTATVTTDKKVQNYELKLFEGNSTLGTWKGSWRINDTHNYTYRETFKAVSGADKSQVDLTFK